MAASKQRYASGLVRPMTLAVRAVGIFFLLVTAACAGEIVAPPSAIPPLIADPSWVGQNQDAPVATAAPPQAKAPAKASASPVAIEQPRKKENPPPDARKPDPPLDVAALKVRLRDTSAIGVFTKLALKNQMDDLLKQFRAYYLSGQKASVASLRQAYDMLLLKVLALIQDSDPSLARTISGSRETIWGILSDPEKFNSMT